MLIDYPAVKKELSSVLMQIFKQSIKGELPAFQGIKRIMQHEGKKASYSTVEGSIKDQNYQKAEVNYKIQYADVPDMDLQKTISLIEQKGEEMGSQMGRYFFSTMTQVINETGNIVDAAGERFSLDLMFEALEKIEIAFDEQGNPIMPTLVIHPNMTPRVQALIKKEEKEKKYEERHQKLIERKRKEWYEKQSHRKLVD